MRGYRQSTSFASARARAGTVWGDIVLNKNAFARVLLVAGCSIAAATASSGDTWLRTISDIQPKASIRTSDGGALIAGFSGLGQGGYYAAVLSHLNGQGAVLWQQLYGGARNEIFYGVVAIPSGGYLAVGVTDSFPSFATAWSLWLVRVDDAGQILWQKYAAMGYDAIPASVALAGDGNIVVAGMTRPGYDWQSPYDAFLFKITSDGDLLWCKTYGAGGYERFARVVPYGSGFAAVGSLKDSGAGTSFDAWVVGLYDAGTVLWQNRFGSAKDDYGLDLLPTSDGGLLVAARNPLGAAGGGDAWLIKIDSAQAVEWQNTYGGSQYEEADRLVESGEGFVAAGVETSWPPPMQGYAGDPKLWVFEVDHAGCLLWQRAFRYRDTYGSMHFTTGLLTSPDGGFLVTDYQTPFRSACGGAEFVKLDADGALGSPCLSDITTQASVSATTAGADTSIPASTITLTLKDSTGSAQTFQSEMKECHPGQVQAPTGPPEVTVEDVDDCTDTGVRISWPPDPAIDWGDGGLGTRTYDLMVNGYAVLQSCLPYGTTSFVDTSGTNNQDYTYWIRYSNGADLTLESQAVPGTDVVSYPSAPAAAQAADIDPLRATGVALTWSAPPDWGDSGRDPSTRGFLIYDGDMSPVSALLPATATSFTDTTGQVNPPGPCGYQVAAVNACGNEMRTDYLWAQDAAAPPGETSGPGHALSAFKAGGTAVSVSFSPRGCVSGNTIYWGLWDPQFPGPYFESALCLPDAAASATFDPGDPAPGTFLFFVVVGNNHTAEGSYGQDSTGAERWPASPPGSCHYPQDLQPGCPY